MLSLNIGQRILTRLAGPNGPTEELTEQVIADFLHPIQVNGAEVRPVMLESGRMTRPDWVFAVLHA